MRCPYCGYGESKVTDSRNASDTNAIRRRRECLQCAKRFTTFETVDLTIQVRKRNGTYEDFQIDKLIRGLAAACRHTRISHEQVQALGSDIAHEIMEKKMKEVETTEIGEIVMQRLKKLDTVAYIRFACVYRRFKDVDELMNVVKEIDDEIYKN
jgi:transcriptional repressor NrdR